LSYSFIKFIIIKSKLFQR